MAFPQHRQPLRTEIFVDNEWADISSDVRYDMGVVISRGRRNEQARITPGSMTVKLDNRSHDYSLHNPNATYYAKLRRGTKIRQSIVLAYDTFGRTESGGLGSSSDTTYDNLTSYAWTVVGTAANYSVGSGKAAFSMASVGVAREAYLAGLSRRDQRVTVTVAPTAVATGSFPSSSIDMGAVVRRTDDSNFYWGFVKFNPDRTMSVELAKVVAGVESTLNLTTFDVCYSASTTVTLELTAVGRFLQLTAWLDADPDESVTITATDSSFTSTNPPGIRAILRTGNTNANLSVTFDGFRVDDGRFAGDIAALPNRWDGTGSDKYMPIEAAGPLRRLSAPADESLRSPIYRAFSRGSLPDSELDPPVAYWPLEDESGSTLAASGVSGGSPMLATGITFANGNALPGSDSLPSINGDGRLTGSVSGADLPWLVTFWLDGTYDTGSPSIIAWQGTAAGPGGITTGDPVAETWRVTVTNTAATLSVLSDAGISIFTAAVAGDFLDGESHLYMVAGESSGTTVTGTLYVDGTSATNNSSPYLLGQMVGQMAPGATPTDVDTAHIGHLTVWSTINADSTLSDEMEIVGSGHTGETAGERVERLCGEEDVTFVPFGDHTLSALCGPQRIAKLTDLLNDAVEADQGVLLEVRELDGLGFIRHAALYNQSGLDLDYDAGHLSDALWPTSDDQAICNVFTAKMYGGGSASAFRASGDLGFDAIGRHDETLTVNVHHINQIQDIADWRLALGTRVEDRYEKVTAELHRTPFTASAALTRAAAQLDTGGYLSIDNPPAWTQPDLVELLVQGYTEVLRTFTRTLSWVCVPGVLYNTPVIDTGRVDSDSTLLHASITAGATTALLANISREATPSLWSTSAEPYDLRLSSGPDLLGETVTVTAMAAAGTPTIGATGTSAHGDYAALTPTTPSRAAGDLLLCFAACRNASAVVRRPLGWTQLLSVDGGHIKLFGRVATNTSADDVEIVFTGGTTGDTTSAQMAVFSNVQNRVVDSTTQSNSSAADIATPSMVISRYPALVVYLGWKQDDWTSVTPVSGSTEIGDTSSTSGSDQGITWSAVAISAGGTIAAGTFAVTGGAAAVSKSAVLILDAGIQSATVTRAVNGVSRSWGAGTRAQLADRRFIGLRG